MINSTILARAVAGPLLWLVHRAFVAEGYDRWVWGNVSFHGPTRFCRLAFEATSRLDAEMGEAKGSVKRSNLVLAYHAKFRTRNGFAGFMLLNEDFVAGESDSIALALVFMATYTKLLREENAALRVAFDSARATAYKHGLHWDYPTSLLHMFS